MLKSKTSSRLADPSASFQQGLAAQTLSSKLPLVAIGAAAKAHRGAQLSRAVLASARAGRLGSPRSPTVVERNNEIVTSAAQELGIVVTALPGGFLELRHGEEVHFSRGPYLDFENRMAGSTCADKSITSTVLTRDGLPVPRFGNFSLGQFEESLAFFHSCRKPVVVKPTHGTSGGIGVSVNVSSTRRFSWAFARARAYSRRVTVEEQAPGEMYRFFVLAGRVLCVVKRLPAYVTGDGLHTVDELIEQKNTAFRAGDSAHRLKTIEVDGEVRRMLRRRGLSLRAIPRSGEHVRLREQDGGVTEDGGEIRDVTEITHPDYVQMALRAAEAMRVRFSAVDLLAEDISRSAEEAEVVINEVNSAPDLWNPALGLGHPSTQTVQEVLRHVFKDQDEI